MRILETAAAAAIPAMYHDRRQHLHIAAQLCGGLGDEIDQATPPSILS